MEILEKYNTLVADVEEAQETATKAEGALEQLKSELKKVFKCDSILAAKKKLKGFLKQKEHLEKEFARTLKIFEDKWNESA